MRSVHPRPLVSIVIPTFNRPDTLRRSVESVLAQTYENIEIVVVNDGGVAVESVLLGADTRGQVVHLRLPMNRGMSVARNHALRIVRGEYIGFLDDDDFLDPHHVETMVKALSAGEHRIGYANTRRRIELEENGVLVVKRIDDPLPDWCREYDRDAFLYTNLMPIQSVMLHRSCIEECGPFDEGLAVLEDWELWLRISRKFPFLHVRTTTSTVNWRPDGITRRRARDFMGSAKRIIDRYKDDAAGKPEILEAQARLLAAHGRVELHQKPAVSIVLALRNERAGHVRGFLQHVAAVTRGFSTEIIVVDRGLHADAAAELARLDVHVVRAAGHLAFALQRGVEKARGQYVATVRSDVLLEDGWLIALVAAAESRGAALTIAGAKTLTPKGLVEHAGLEFRKLDGTPRALFRWLQANAQELATVREVEASASGAVLFPAEVAKELTLGEIDGWACVAELCLRASVRGVNTVLAPRSITYRVPQNESGAWLSAAEEAALGLAAKAILASSMDADLSRARQELGAGRTEAASRILETVRPKDRESQREAALLRAVERIERSEFSEAAAILEEAMENGADGYTPRLSLGVAYLGLHHHEKAWSVLEPLARKHPDDDVVTHEIYRAGLGTARWNELSEILERYVAHCPNDHEKRYALVSVTLRAGRTEVARAHFERLVANAPLLVGLDTLKQRLDRAAA